MSDSAQNDSLLLALEGGEVIEWIDLAFLRNWEGEGVAGVVAAEEEGVAVAAAKAASMAAISSSLTSSVWMSTPQLMRDNLENDSKRLDSFIFG